VEKPEKSILYVKNNNRFLALALDEIIQLVDESPEMLLDPSLKIQEVLVKRMRVLQKHHKNMEDHVMARAINNVINYILWSTSAVITSKALNDIQRQVSDYDVKTSSAADLQYQRLQQYIQKIKRDKQGDS